jgi:NAD(P)H-hydrate repair Nnr-like enzyme with NAD(P)H-hydrate dehydratase domain
MRENKKNLNSLLNRKPDTHKYDYGYCLVIGKAPGTIGAPWLCANAAQREYKIMVIV